MYEIKEIKSNVYRKQSEVLFWERFQYVPNEKELGEFIDLKNQKAAM